MIFKYSKLAGRIKECFGTQKQFANAMNMSERSLSFKLNNHRDWRQSEIFEACRLLSIDIKLAYEYFFQVDEIG